MQARYVFSSRLCEDWVIQRPTGQPGSRWSFLMNHATHKHASSEHYPAP
jgi:hypothetical protein